jgi:hypothetical protein
MGRHKKDDADDRHDEFMGFRLPGRLLALLDGAATEADMYRSDFVREILGCHLMQGDPAPLRRDKPSPELRALVEAIEKAIPATNAVGNLLNQGMRRFHATGKLDVVPGLRVACDRYLSVSQAEQAALSHLLSL